MAADALSIIPGAVLRNLSDKLYEKRKNAALEVRGFDSSGGHGFRAIAGDLRCNFCCRLVLYRLRGS